MIFGSQRDWSIFTGINRELLSNVIEQEILFYKLSLEDTPSNIYGEATERVYWEPLKINCLIVRGDQTTTTDEFGPDLTRTTEFNLLRQDCIDTGLEPEIGDIIRWSENYYEVSNINENQLFLGKDSNYTLTQYGSNFGASVSLLLSAHLTRADRVAIVRSR